MTDGDLQKLMKNGDLKIIIESSLINEAVNIHVHNGKKYISIYVRNHSEGRGSSINHRPSIKAQRCGSDGKTKKPMFEYTIPSGSNYDNQPRMINDKDKECKDFHREHGDVVCAFIKSYQDELLEYWNSDNEKEKELYEKFFKEL